MEPLDVIEHLGRWSAGRGPLYLLLADRLRKLIDDGDLPPATALPPDRVLAAALAVGRSTVVAAYDELSTAGRIVRRRGSGTRVAGSPETSTSVVPTTGSPAFLHLLEPSDGMIMLACAAPASPPRELVDAFTAAIPLLAGIRDDIGYHPAGHPMLREAVASRFVERGVPTRPDQILVTSGAQQALSLLARALVRAGDRVLVEVPTYPGALEAFRDQGAALRGGAVGLPDLERSITDHHPVLAYVVATHHNPTGAVLPTLRRERLVRDATGAGVTLVDDEVLADVTFPGHETPQPLAAHDDRVVTVGSLSKVVWGGLRIGWIRASTPLIGRLARIRAVHDLGGNVHSQLAAAHLLARQDDRRARGAQRRLVAHDRLRRALAQEVPEWDVPAVLGGQTLWVRLPTGDGTSFAHVASRHGVVVLPGSGLDATGGSHSFLRLHFIAPPDQLDEAARRLGAAWRDYRPPSRRRRTVPQLAV